MRTANPALNDHAFAGVLAQPYGTEVMTVSGTVNKTLLSVIITAVAALFVWNSPQLATLSLPAAIIGFILALVISFKQTWAPFLTPAYAAAEGVFLGAFSLYAEQFYPGIPAQAVGLTVATTLCLLLAYKSGAIVVTDKFRKGLFAATAGLALFYLGAFIAQLCGFSLPFLTSSSPLSIGFSIVVVAIAALNLVLDFDFIEKAAASRTAPKYLEWYGAFGLLVTLVWLYVEIVRLLMKTRRD